MTVAQPRITLQPFDADNEIDVGQFHRFRPLHVSTLTLHATAELRRQRILCGWGIGDVDGWLKESRKGDKGLYWVIATPAPQLDPYAEPFSLRKGVGPPPPNLEFQ